MKYSASKSISKDYMITGIVTPCPITHKDNPVVSYTDKKITAHNGGLNIRLDVSKNPLGQGLYKLDGSITDEIQPVSIPPTRKPNRKQRLASRHK